MKKIIKLDESGKVYIPATEKYGEKLLEVSEFLLCFDDEDSISFNEKTGNFDITLEGEEFTLVISDEFKSKNEKWENSYYYKELLKGKNDSITGAKIAQSLSITNEIECYRKFLEEESKKSKSKLAINAGIDITYLTLLTIATTQMKGTMQKIEIGLLSILAIIDGLSISDYVNKYKKSKKDLNYFNIVSENMTNKYGEEIKDKYLIVLHKANNLLNLVSKLPKKAQKRYRIYIKSDILSYHNSLFIHDVFDDINIDDINKGHITYFDDLEKSILEELENNKTNHGSLIHRLRNK